MDSWESTGEPGHVHIGVCAYSLRGVPGRYEYIWSLCWCGWRDSTDFLFLWLCFGGYGTIEQVGVAGQYGFSVFLALFLAGTVQLKWWGVLYLTFHFLQFAVSSLGGWICAVGILRYFCYGVL